MVLASTCFGPRQHSLCFASRHRTLTLTSSLIISLFLTNIEIPIVTTAVATITDDLGGFDRASWITSAYLLGYVGVLIIWTKLSDIFGRKLLYAISLVLFIIFSAACGAAQNLTQLYVDQDIPTQISCSQWASA